MMWPTKSDSEKGLVFNIQRFSIHDGPGIRTTVFMKGCPLRCLWCSNPESQAFSPSLMVRDVNCSRCGKCAQTCPRQAISMDKDMGRVINWEKCDQCLKCVSDCIYQSLNCCGQYMTVEEIIREVLKDSLFYKNSNGGVTISGGEPLMQLKFLMKLLQALKEKESHVALDTSGYVPKKGFEEVLPFVDLVLFDIKHLDDEKHRRFTGVSNQGILANARVVAEKVRTWFRIPLIENFNDDVDHIARLADIAREIGIEKISMLPYHEGGIPKCRQIGQDYLMPEARSPSDGHIEALKIIILQKGVNVTINH
jgi:pyruvate formate lyase activating enzyme